MSSLLQFRFALALVIVAAKAAGYLSTRLGYPAVLGELLVGLILVRIYTGHAPLERADLSWRGT